MIRFHNRFIATVSTLLFVGALSGATIDSFTFNNFIGEEHTPDNALHVFGSSGVYSMSDGSEWHSGAGTFYFGSAAPVSESVSNGMLTMTLLPTFAPFLYRYPEEVALFYSDFGDGITAPRTQAQFDFSGPMTLTAQVGSTTATLSGSVVLVENLLDYAGDPGFRYFSFPIGSNVAFTETIQIISDSWTSYSLDT